MANRNFHRVQSLVRELKLLNAHITIGSSGAPTLSTTKSNGVASISRTSEGLYVLTLDDKYNQLIDFHAMVLNSSIDDLQVQVKAESVASAKTITFNTKSPTDSSTTTQVVNDPANGTVLLLTILVKNTDIK